MSQPSENAALLARLERLEQQQSQLLDEQRALYRQMEALFALYHQFNFRAPVLALRGWAASPDFAALLAAQILEQRPRTILELGGGKTTLISAYSLEQVGGGQVIALDHEARFAEATRHTLHAHGLSAYASVLHAPLRPYTLDGQSTLWYDLAGLPSDLTIDLLVVDGPPQAPDAAALARYPALPLLEGRLNPGAFILVDDADRPAETQAAALWQQRYPLTLVRHYERAYGDSEKGALLLRWR